jgi:hypothetical protein
MKKNWDVVRPSEEAIEAKWHKEGGIRASTGRAWLTPRMIRNARRLQYQWNKSILDKIDKKLAKLDEKEKRK